MVNEPVGLCNESAGLGASASKATSAWINFQIRRQSQHQAWSEIKLWSGLPEMFGVKGKTSAGGQSETIVTAFAWRDWREPRNSQESAFLPRGDPETIRTHLKGYSFSQLGPAGTCLLWLFGLAWCTAVAAEDAAFTRVTHVYARPCSAAPSFLHKDQFLEVPCPVPGEMLFIGRIGDQAVTSESGRRSERSAVTLWLSQHPQTFPARRCYETGIGAPRARLAGWPP